MNDIPDAAILRVYVGEADKVGSRSLYDVIVSKAMDAGLSGATVLRGAAGFGASHSLHTSKILRLSMDLPVVVEIVDSAGKIEAFLPEIAPLIPSGIATVQRVRMVRFASGPQA